MNNADLTIYCQRLDDLLQGIQQVKGEIYEEALLLISDLGSYNLENTTELDLKSGIDALKLLLTFTTDDVPRRLNTLYDLTNEDYVRLYPLTLLTFEANDKIRLLTEIMNGIQTQCDKA